MGTPFLSRFTPSVMAPETLEAIFVQREELADRLTSLIEASALSDSKQHNLLIGPRGIGKTHLVSIVYHRARQLDCFKNNRLVIAWLREEEWGVMSFLDLLLRILRALVAESNSELEAQVESLYQHSPDTAEHLGGNLLKDFVGNRTLLVIVENLDDLFLGIEDEGQKRLRSYIQENPFITILATSQSLFGGVSLQTSPFYGFFRINHLEELSLDEATLLLKKVAELEGDTDLASLLDTSLGRVRIRALQKLAGGNHRVYIIFSQFLTRESLTELIEAMMRTLDELTPYYQERIKWLSPQQRKIVELLSDRGNALTVKEIATRCFMSQQTASAQLKLLREWGYVRTNRVGRQSYYELREPLMRLCVEVKKHRAEPIRLVVELLRSWYTGDELRRRLDKLPEAFGGRQSEREHIAAALHLYQRAEILVSLSKPNSIDQALLRLITGDDSERDRDIEIASDAMKRIGLLTMRRHNVVYDSAVTAEDVAQSSWVKLLGAIEKGDFTPEQLAHPSNYVYEIISETVTAEINHQWPSNKRIQLIKVDKLASPTSPDEIVELRVRLLEYIRMYLFDTAEKAHNLRRRLEDLMGAVVESGAEDVLSEALIKYFVALVSSEGREAAAPELRKWNKIAIKVLGSSSEFDLVLRVLATIIRYVNTNDKTAFFDLRLEERAFVEPLLDDVAA
jgi:DNA-binding transcriptional ArsR family regulator